MATNSESMKMTVEEYLAFDRASEIKHEYDDGEAVAMSGGSVEHSALAVSMTYLLAQQLGDEGPCRVYNSDVRTLVAKRQYVYADVVVSCDVADHRPGNDIIRAPHLIVEVLSPSTELKDRGKKLNWYQAQPSVQEYVLINYRMRLVEVYRRGEGDAWSYITCGPGQTITLESLDIDIDVDTLYGRLAIPAPE